MLIAVPRALSNVFTSSAADCLVRGLLVQFKCYMPWYTPSYTPCRELDVRTELGIIHIHTTPRTDFLCFVIKFVEITRSVLGHVPLVRRTAQRTSCAISLHCFIFLASLVRP